MSTLPTRSRNSRHSRVTSELKKAVRSGNGVFMPSEVVYLIDARQDHRVQRTVYHDLESILWTILYAVFKHTRDSLSESASKPTKRPKRFRRRIFEEEYRGIFPSFSVKDIAPTIWVPQKIEHFMRYIAQTDPILVELIDTTWNRLRICQPVLVFTERPFRPRPAAALAKTSIHLPEQSASLDASAAQQLWAVPSEGAKALRHDVVGDVLDVLLAELDQDRAEGRTRVPEPEWGPEELENTSDQESDWNSDHIHLKSTSVARTDSPLRFGSSLDSDSDDDNDDDNDNHSDAANDDGRFAGDMSRTMVVTYRASMTMETRATETSIRARA
ncbi:hypothetical protein C8Q77DRAFT_5695 [Trametes polyzona]|nr:hypothetical protein C8Q77DRAFT_5695 [Trametes polyzona]